MTQILFFDAIAKCQKYNDINIVPHNAFLCEFFVSIFNCLRISSADYMNFVICPDIPGSHFQLEEFINDLKVVGSTPIYLQVLGKEIGGGGGGGVTSYIFALDTSLSTTKIPIKIPNVQRCMWQFFLAQFYDHTNKSIPICLSCIFPAINHY